MSTVDGLMELVHNYAGLVGETYGYPAASHDARTKMELEIRAYAGQMADRAFRPSGEPPEGVVHPVEAPVQLPDAANPASAAFEELMHLFCWAADNLGDMPISDAWAERWYGEARTLLDANNHFRTFRLALAASDSKEQRSTESLEAAFESEIELIAPDQRAVHYYFWKRMKERVGAPPFPPSREKE